MSDDTRGLSAKSPEKEPFGEIERIYVPELVASARKRAEMLAGRRPMTQRDAVRSFEELFTGTASESEPPFWERHLLLIACASLTLMFGGFGLYSTEKEATRNFLDIAKVFAGGIVGSAGTSALAGARRSKARAAV
jgi:hypothetical protein